MIRSTMPARIAGVLLLLAACGTTLLHRQVWLAARDGPVALAELVLGLGSFTLATLGIVLLVSGRHPRRVVTFCNLASRRRWPG